MSSKRSLTGRRIASMGSNSGGKAFRAISLFFNPAYRSWAKSLLGA